MGLILNLETATKICSVSLAKDGETIAIKELHKDYSHSEVITLFIDEVLQTAGYKAADVDAIAVSKGPGSYTGLRIGVSTAKGLCYAMEKPLIAVGTLDAMALHKKLPNGDYLYCPMIDARRMEVYAAIYDEAGNTIRGVQADIVGETTYAAYLEKQKVCFFGDGAAKCMEVINHPNAVLVEDIFPTAESMAVLSEQAFAAKQFEDVAYFEPYYLKDFMATTPKDQLAG